MIWPRCSNSLRSAVPSWPESSHGLSLLPKRDCSTRKAKPARPNQPLTSAPYSCVPTTLSKKWEALLRCPQLVQQHWDETEQYNRQRAIVPVHGFFFELFFSRALDGKHFLKSHGSSQVSRFPTLTGRVGSGRVRSGRVGSGHPIA